MTLPLVARAARYKQAMRTLAELIYQGRSLGLGGGSDKKNKAGLSCGIGAAYALNQNGSLHLDCDHVPVKYNSMQRRRSTFFAGRFLPLLWGAVSRRWPDGGRP
ncbi:hypothetical protein BA896_007250 [Janthinobacterium lividum]|uniref:Uncharacterized protein n=1 Tax=Janthinobacterium lividum TaxID=29581 RepID=A0A1E8PR97_9BURK|nr:hypothetical protein BA896_007250 [Janthinobacterium lividum]